jgi:hypothetical protein
MLSRKFQRINKSWNIFCNFFLEHQIFLHLEKKFFSLFAVFSACTVINYSAKNGDYLCDKKFTLFNFLIFKILIPNLFKHKKYFLFVKYINKMGGRSCKILSLLMYTCWIKYLTCVVNGLYSVLTWKYYCRSNLTKLILMWSSLS